MESYLASIERRRRHLPCSFVYGSLELLVSSLGMEKGKAEIDASWGPTMRIFLEKESRGRRATLFESAYELVLGRESQREKSALS
jgi:hypothetical protein